MHQIPLRQICNCGGACDLAIAQDRRTVCNLEYLIQIVRNVDERRA